LTHHEFGGSIQQQQKRCATLYLYTEKIPMLQHSDEEGYNLRTMQIAILGLVGVMVISVVILVIVVALQ